MPMANLNYYVLTYQVVSNYLEFRIPYRKEHIQLAMEFSEKGYLVLGGALEEPSDGAVLIFHAPDLSIIEDFVKRDPYVKAGGVTGWTIRKWKAVVGTACKSPIQLASL